MTALAASDAPLTPAQLAATLLSVDRATAAIAIAAVPAVTRPAGLEVLAAQTIPQLQRTLRLGKPVGAKIANFYHCS